VETEMVSGLTLNFDLEVHKGITQSSQRNLTREQTKKIALRFREKHQIVKKEIIFILFATV